MASATESQQRPALTSKYVAGAGPAFVLLVQLELRNDVEDDLGDLCISWPDRRSPLLRPLRVAEAARNARTGRNWGQPRPPKKVNSSNNGRWRRPTFHYAARRRLKNCTFAERAPAAHQAVRLVSTSPRSLALPRSTCRPREPVNVRQGGRLPPAQGWKGHYPARDPLRSLGRSTSAFWRAAWTSQVMHASLQTPSALHKFTNSHHAAWPFVFLPRIRRAVL